MTAPNPVTTEDELDDFTPQCQVDEPVNGKRTNCTQPAVWVGISPCGHDSFFCETHHHDHRTFKCHTCDYCTLLALYRWIRL